MPYPRAHALVTWFGDAFSSAEWWQTGLRIDGVEAPSNIQLAALDLAFEEMVSAGALGLPAGHRYLGLKWAPQTTAGRYPDSNDAIEFLRETALVGNSGDSYPQIALALSMRTARTRGYASNGRMYLPNARPILASTGLISQSDVDSAAFIGATFVAAVNNVGLGSAVVGSTVGAGRFEAITAVRVGRVMDTQRRRRNQLPELYSEASPVPS